MKSASNYGKNLLLGLEKLTPVKVGNFESLSCLSDLEEKPAFSGLVQGQASLLQSK